MAFEIHKILLPDGLGGTRHQDKNQIWRHLDLLVRDHPEASFPAGRPLVHPQTRYLDSRVASYCVSQNFATL